MCSDDTYVYLIGGCEGDKCKNDCYRYDSKTNLWSALSPMNRERSQAAAVYFNGKLYVFGGYTSNRCLSSCEILTLSTNEWIISINGIQNELNIPRVGVGITVCKEKLYVIGGFDGRNFLKSIEVYDENSQRWKLSYNK
jgi:Kelch motif